MFKLYLLLFTSFCCFCHAGIEYHIIPLDSAGETYDLGMIRPPLGPNAKGQSITSSVDSFGYHRDICLEDPTKGKISIKNTGLLPTFIGDSGHVVGPIGPFEGHGHGYIWSQESGFRTIFAVYRYCHPQAVNNNGEVIFRDRERWGAAYHFTFLTTSDNRTLYVEFNSRRAPEGSCLGNALNDHRQVVGSFKGYYFGTHAFIWDENNGIRDLRTLIPSDSEWDDLIEAKYINNDGLIAGDGIFNGQPTEFLLIPME